MKFICYLRIIAVILFVFCLLIIVIFVKTIFRHVMELQSVGVKQQLHFLQLIQLQLNQLQPNQKQLNQLQLTQLQLNKLQLNQ